jgi:hypothetical protein
MGQNMWVMIYSNIDISSESEEETDIKFRDTFRMFFKSCLKWEGFGDVG